MLATSAAFTVVSFFSLRMRPEAFSPVKCRLAVWPRRILPPAVTLKRLRAPRCVFNFIFGFEAFLGIAKTFLLQMRVALSAPQRCQPCFRCGAAVLRPHKTDPLPYCACCEAVCPTDRESPAPFLGAKSATR